MSEFDFGSLIKKKKESTNPEQPVEAEQPTKSEDGLLTNQTTNISTSGRKGDKTAKKDAIIEI